MQLTKPYIYLSNQFDLCCDLTLRDKSIRFDSVFIRTRTDTGGCPDAVPPYGRYPGYGSHALQIRYTVHASDTKNTEHAIGSLRRILVS